MCPTRRVIVRTWSPTLQTKPSHRHALPALLRYVSDCAPMQKTTGLASCIGPARTLLSWPRTPYHPLAAHLPNPFNTRFVVFGSPAAPLSPKRRRQPPPTTRSRQPCTHTPSVRGDGCLACGRSLAGFAHGRDDDDTSTCAQIGTSTRQDSAFSHLAAA